MTMEERGPKRNKDAKDPKLAGKKKAVLRVVLDVSVPTGVER